MFTPQQEQFLSEFYSLCSRYQHNGVCSWSLGFVERHYQIMLLIQPEKKDLDGAGLVVEFGFTPSSLQKH